MNVHEQNHDMYFSFSVVDSDTSYCLYKIKGYDDGTFDLNLLSKKSYGPNILYSQDGSYELNYMHYSSDDDDYKLFYLNYDKNGNQIKN